jgi:hypothetical protein
MPTGAQIETNRIGDKLEALFARLAAEGIEIGIRERVIAGRIATEIAIEQSSLSRDRWAFLLRARLTPALAKSPEQVGRVHLAFRDAFPPLTQPVPADRADGRARVSLPGRSRRGRRIRAAARTAVGAGLIITGVALILWFMPQRQQAVVGNGVPRATQRPTPQPPAPAREASAETSLTSAQLDPIVKEIMAAAGSNKNVSVAGLAAKLAPGDPTGADVRRLISLFQRYHPASPHENFVLTDISLANLARALASQRYPGRTVSPDAMTAAVASARLESAADSGRDLNPVSLPVPRESFLTPSWLTAGLFTLPLIPTICWLLGRRRRLMDYLRRRTPERPPLVHELVVHASADASRERTTLTRAALRLGRSRDGLARTIDVESTVEATARGGGFPHVVFALARSSPEYLVLISSKGPEDHSAHHLDRLVTDLADQNLSLVRYFISHDANLCFDSSYGPYFNLEQLAARYPDHRLIFFGTGEQLLDPGTLAAWPWAEELGSWRRRAILTPTPPVEWGGREIALARLFDAPPLRADADGLLRLAELFERHDPPGSEQFAVREDPARWTWTSRPRRWLIPVPPDGRAMDLLESEIARYFTDARGVFDESAFWWFAACAIYPALRWDLTVYLGLKLVAPRVNGGMPLYSEERALRLAVLPWFRDGFMPDWLRRRLIALLPKTVRLQAFALLRDLFNRAVKSGNESFDAVRLRIAQDQPDPTAARPERDEIFLDALARADDLAFEAPRNLRAMIGAMKDPFVAREWGTLALIAAYWAAAAWLVPWPSDGALATGSWLPVLLLALVIVTLPVARRISRWGRGRSDPTPPAAAAVKD